MLVLDDNDVRAAPASVVVDAAREALLQFGRGELIAPPRTRAELGNVDYIYTVGALADGTSGFRAYRAGQRAGDQLVAVWDPDGQLTGLVIGDELGARRTGALGAVAADALARPDANTVGLIGRRAASLDAAVGADRRPRHPTGPRVQPHPPPPVRVRRPGQQRTRGRGQRRRRRRDRRPGSRHRRARHQVNHTRHHRR
jgi:hypothetical protein